MSKKSNHQGDISNANKGTTGSNSTFNQANANRSNQMNPNNSNYRGKK